MTLPDAQSVILQVPSARTKYVIEVPAGGLTVKLAPAPMDVPTPHSPSYHTQTAPVPSEPPVTVNVLLVPKQVLSFVTVMPVGEVDSLPTVTAITLCKLVPQEFDAVTPIFPFAPEFPVLTIMVAVPLPSVIVHPNGTSHA